MRGARAARANEPPVHAQTPAEERRALIVLLSVIFLMIAALAFAQNIQEAFAIRF